MTFDVAIAGLGAMGSAAAYFLTRRGERVIGFDRFHPPHDQGSHFGQTRIIREAYFEHPLYVPLVRRAYSCWAEIEKASEQKLLLQTGGLTIGPPGGEVVEGTRKSAREFDIPCEILSSAELRKRFPAFRPAEGMLGVFEKRAGILYPEKCIESCLALARKGGSDLHFDEPVESWTAGESEVKIKTARGIYTAGKLLICAGAWESGLLGGVSLPLAPERNALFWFAPKANGGHFLPEKLPIFIFEYDSGRLFYGFPDLGEGVKIAHHHHDRAPADPDTIDRTVHPDEVEKLRALVRPYMPDAPGRLLASSVCMYTNTPDEHFVIDFHPAHRNVIVASPCSGHGFKFASALGEICAGLLTGGSPPFDLSPFRISRLLK